MTAETLKPFITPTSAVDNYPTMQSSINNTSHPQRKPRLVAIALTIVALTLTGILLGFTIWNSTRVSKLENDLAEQIKVIESLHERLGIHYLDDLNDFQKEVENTLIDDPDILDDADIADDDRDDDQESDQDDDDQDDIDLDDDEDDEDVDIDYAELIKKYENYDENREHDEEGANNSNDDNLYDDFGKFQDSKKKKPRKPRSISELRNEIQSYDEQTQQQNKTAIVKQEEANKQNRHKFTSPPHGQTNRSGITHRQRTRTARRQRFPILKSGESLLSAKSAALMSSMLYTKPAAHFHLHDTKADASPGNVYIGHPSVASSEANWQQFFSLDNGWLTVRQSGLYYAYAQICYNNTHDENGFVIFHGHKPFLQCLNTVPTDMLKLHTCHTSGLIYLEENETLHLRDFHTNRNAVLKNSSNRSYFGLFKV